VNDNRWWIGFSILRHDEKFLAIINPAAGGGRCRKLVGPALERLRAGGIALEMIETSATGDATRIARTRMRVAIGSFWRWVEMELRNEIVNGFFSGCTNVNGEKERVPALGFLPLGTGNSFLRDFGDQGVEHAMRALLDRRSRACDVLRLTHQGGVLHYINLLSLGFAADVNILRQRRFRSSGQLGYWASIFSRTGAVEAEAFPVRGGGPE